MRARRRPIGYIADDITGATDLASALAGRGLAVRLAFGSEGVQSDAADAIVIALKIRSVPSNDARASAVRAARALRAAGAEQLFFKYCSTFDSTPEGNIGPIADALIDLTGARRVVHAPSYPANGRTVYLGHLFVGDELLSDSPMRNHPLNPMHDARLRRVLSEQTSRYVALLRKPAIDSGVGAVTARLAEIAPTPGPHHVIADALSDSDLDTIAAATAEDPLAAGAAPYGASFGAAAQARSGQRAGSPTQRAKLPTGATAILAGSLSRATRGQIVAFDGATLTLSSGDLLGGDAIGRAREFAEHAFADGPFLIATAEDAGGGSPLPAGLTSAQISQAIERAMGQLSVELATLGVRRLIVAGGETSGAVADALAIRSARIGPDVSVGVPWIVAEDRDLALVFKSGNFGAASFFRDALEVAGS